MVLEVLVTGVLKVEKPWDLIWLSMPVPPPLTCLRWPWILWSSHWEGGPARDMCTASRGRCPSLLVVFEMRSSQGAASLYVMTLSKFITIRSMANVLVLMVELTGRPSFFHCTRTRPGFSQSEGCILLTSWSVPNPKREQASAISLLRGHHTLLDREIRRAPVAYGRFASI